MKVGKVLYSCGIVWNWEIYAEFCRILELNFSSEELN